MLIHKDKPRGFTIVELLIVIVVIAILAAISIVAYNGIQARANNSKIASAAVSIEKALKLWYIDTGKQPYTGASSTAAMPANPTGEACPGATNASGWAVKGAYACTLEDLLLGYKLIPSTLFPSLPPNKETNNTNRQVFMFYRCTSVAAGNAYILMWYLDAPSSADDEHTLQEYRKCANNNQSVVFSTSVYYTDYGMRGMKYLEF